MMPVVMGFMQFFIHGIAMNVRIGSVYNPVRSTFGWMADPASPYPITEDEMHRWDAPSKLWR